ncbi:glycine--tRNA ligase subunit beta [Bartonella doshiae]|uniref:Glycine--tRNA ligase beta subunit n=2 Tax=Bartonella doshiae TaxID=33044 RepID=A0A380ZHT8_BARDO|nr:glycine--tRNA ligase subunit beta [Bartonella doshiae]EJF82028.1 glycine-tRNA ligase, beta subunit [Bartonella doshiae NCTC 12862 = ATCC 700133]MBB6159023.1 glycyl-tRNA synthetase beta chain [Bartonella doshiae]SUV44546.1 Glycine--tRNA ligase beta subunit [Bartonella doshiae]
MSDLLLELFSEEIPARMQRKAAADLKKSVTDQLVKAGLTYKAAREYWTPRRLTLDVRGLSTRSKDIQEERKGPNIQSPQHVIDGFLRTTGLSDISEANIAHDNKKGDFYVAKIIKKGRSAEEIIADILPNIIRNFPWPRSMRWGEDSAKNGALKWIRSLQNILCIFGPEIGETHVIPFTIGSLQSNNVTYGHRFLSNGKPLQIRRFDDYVTQLESHKVILDAERRKNIILADAQNLCFANGLELVQDSTLLEEIAGLVEWPVVLMGNFDKSFLDIPPEIIRLTIRANQKCFVTRKQGETIELSHYFILVSNILANDEGKEISKGNSKVVCARLSDAFYFWQTDQHNLPDIKQFESSAKKFALDLNKPLDQRIARLDHLNVTFHAKLGTQGERVERIATLAQEIAPLVQADPFLAKRAAILAKADLQTEVVGEFPELQGLMGRKYALLQGEDPRVAEAIEDHYKPQGPTDYIPQEPLAIAVALADKIDMLVGFWLINEKPTGSKDPYALRRAALGIIRLVLLRDWKINLMPLFHVAKNLFLQQKNKYETFQIENTQSQNQLLKNTEHILLDLLYFFHERLKIYLKEKGVRYDAIEAVLNKDADDFLLVARHVEALIGFINTNKGDSFLAAVKRTVNILENELPKNSTIADDINPELLIETEEKQLYQEIIEVEKKVCCHIHTANLSLALDILVPLGKFIDTFFEKVLVNDKNPNVRANRLALLKRIRTITQMFVDFSKLAV